MTPSQINIAIAEVCGWKLRVESWPDGFKDRWVHESWDAEKFGYNDPPDYYNDLNASLQFIEHITKNEGCTFRIENELDGTWFVEVGIDYNAGNVDLAFDESLPIAICEAGLKALNLWTE
jgi:hypothetical protein